MPLITSHPPFPGHTTPLGSQCSVNSRVMCVCVRVCQRERGHLSVCACVYLHSWQSCGGKQGTRLTLVSAERERSVCGHWPSCRKQHAGNSVGQTPSSSPALR